MQKETILESLGLTDKESKTYLAILEMGSASIKPIADKAGIKRTSIYNFIDKLLEMGLVTQTSLRNRTYYQGKSPVRLLELQKERFQLIEQSLPEFMALFNDRASKPKIEYFQGTEQMKNIVREELQCYKEALYIWPGSDIIQMIGGKDFMSNIDKQRIVNGVKIKTIRFKDKDIKFSTSAHGTQFLREMRFAPASINISMGMGVYDTGKVGLFSSLKEGFGILIHSKEMEQMMRVYHQLLWDKSSPAKLGEG